MHVFVAKIKALSVVIVYMQFCRFDRQTYEPNGAVLSGAGSISKVGGTNSGAKRRKFF